MRAPTERKALFAAALAVLAGLAVGFLILRIVILAIPNPAVLLQEASRLLDEGRYEEAEKIAMQVARDHPESRFADEANTLLTEIDIARRALFR